MVHPSQYSISSYYSNTSDYHHYRTSNRYLIEFNEFWSWFQKIFGSYLLLQILFNYNFACFTSPGYIINDVYACNSVKTCAKCNLPKPPRAHHWKGLPNKMWDALKGDLFSALFGLSLSLEGAKEVINERVPHFIIGDK